MAILRDSAVVLRQLDYSETSQILVFFTRGHGKVRAIGKGVKRGTKKRFAVGIDLLDMGQAAFSGRQERGGLAALTEWKQTRSLVGLREALARLYAAEYAAEVTDGLTVDWDPHPEVFDALVDTLVGLCDAAEPLGWVIGFQRQLLDAVGLLPRFEACVLCGRAEDLTYFSSLEGGMICRHCEPGQIEKREVTSATLEVVQRAEPPPPRPGAFSLLNYHIAYTLGREPRLAAKLVEPARRRIVE